jgi:hypothetical protein
MINISFYRPVLTTHAARTKTHSAERVSARASCAARIVLNSSQFFIFKKAAPVMNGLAKLSVRGVGVQIVSQS